MRPVLMPMVGLLMLTACNSAKATSPDPENPAHCIAAFSYVRTIMLGGRRPDMRGALIATARSLFEMKQLKGSGTTDGEEVGAALLSQYAKNEDAMMKLLKRCFEKQDADPVFQAANTSGILMATARKVDPASKNDPLCRAGKAY